MAFCQNNADRFAHYNPTFSPILAIWYTRSTQEWNDQLGVVGGKHFHNPFHKWCIAPAIFTLHVIQLVISPVFLYRQYLAWLFQYLWFIFAYNMNGKCIFCQRWGRSAFQIFWSTLSSFKYTFIVGMTQRCFRSCCKNVVKIQSLVIYT